MNSTKYEMSKTYQYRKVMKPMLERKRRARINKCLDELKDLIAECMQQQSGDASVKLEKADILELTIQHLRKIKKGSATKTTIGTESFRTGYIQAANEVSRCLASLPKVDIGLGTKLMTHLGVRLNELVSEPARTTAPGTPLNVFCGGGNSCLNQSSSMLSPVSSGYGSDNEYSTVGLLKVAVEEVTTIWRPW